MCICVCVLGACAMLLILSSLSLLFMQPIHYVVVHGPRFSYFYSILSAAASSSPSPVFFATNLLWTA